MPAPRTALKFFLCRKHELGNPPGGLFAKDLFELGVTSDTSEEKTCRRIDRERRHHLAKLFPKLVALHKEVRWHLPITDQTPVARENDSAAAPGFLEKPFPREVRAIEHVTAENTQPSGQPPEHLVGDETRFLDRSHRGNLLLSAGLVAPADTVKYCFSQGKVARKCELL